MKSYARFWRAFYKLECGGNDREELKESLVKSFTNGRTCSLKEMTDAEYDTMCKSIEERNGYKDELRLRRSCCLNMMQALSIDTRDWNRVDAFCMDRRIGGKKFSWLNVDELKALYTKLRVIERKGGLKIFEVNNITNNQKTIRDYGKTEKNSNQWCVKGSC